MEGLPASTQASRKALLSPSSRSPLPRQAHTATQTPRRSNLRAPRQSSPRDLRTAVEIRSFPDCAVMLRSLPRVLSRAWHAPLPRGSLPTRGCASDGTAAGPEIQVRALDGPDKGKGSRTRLHQTLVRGERGVSRAPVAARGGAGGLAWCPRIAWHPVEAP